jgi:hypothetical protein
MTQQKSNWGRGERGGWHDGCQRWGTGGLGHVTYQLVGYILSRLDTLASWLSHLASYIRTCVSSSIHGRYFWALFGGSALRTQMSPSNIAFRIFLVCTLCVIGALLPYVTEVIGLSAQLSSDILCTYVEILRFQLI